MPTCPACSADLVDSAASCPACGAHLTPDAVARIHNEVRTARQVTHPNVCRVQDIGEADGVPFISMEVVDGEDLASLLQRIGRLPQDKGVEVAHALCAGLTAAHARGVVHRDLKPANVMLICTRPGRLRALHRRARVQRHGPRPCSSPSTR